MHILKVLRIFVYIMDDCIHLVDFYNAWIRWTFNNNWNGNSV